MGQMMAVLTSVTKQPAVPPPSQTETITSTSHSPALPSTSSVLTPTTPTQTLSSVTTAAASNKLTAHVEISAVDNNSIFSDNASVDINVSEDEESDDEVAHDNFRRRKARVLRSPTPSEDGSLFKIPAPPHRTVIAADHSPIRAPAQTGSVKAVKRVVNKADIAGPLSKKSKKTEHTEQVKSSSRKDDKSKGAAQKDSDKSKSVSKSSAFSKKDFVKESSRKVKDSGSKSKDSAPAKKDKKSLSEYENFYQQEIDETVNFEGDYNEDGLDVDDVEKIVDKVTMASPISSLHDNPLGLTVIPPGTVTTTINSSTLPSTSRLSATVAVPAIDNTSSVLQAHLSGIAHQLERANELRKYKIRALDRANILKEQEVAALERGNELEQTKQRFREEQAQRGRGRGYGQRGPRGGRGGGGRGRGDYAGWELHQ